MHLNVFLNQSCQPTDLHYCTAQFTPSCDFFFLFSDGSVSIPVPTYWHTYRPTYCSVCVCARKQDYYVFGNLEFDAETALLNAFMFKQISQSCCKIQGGRLTSKCKLSFNKRSPKSGWQGQTPLRPFIVYSFHLHNRELGRVDLLSYSSK